MTLLISLLITAALSSSEHMFHFKHFTKTWQLSDRSYKNALMGSTMKNVLHVDIFSFFVPVIKPLNSNFGKQFENQENISVIQLLWLICKYEQILWNYRMCWNIINPFTAIILQSQFFFFCACICVILHFLPVPSSSHFLPGHRAVGEVGVEGGWDGVGLDSEPKPRLGGAASTGMRRTWDSGVLTDSCWTQAHLIYI